jgi:DNA gyrase subunit A
VRDNTLPLLGRAAQGPMLLRLLPGEQVVGAACVAAEASVLLATRQGRLKRLAVEEIRPCQRGDLGQIGLRLVERSDRLVDLRGGDGSVVGVLLAGGAPGAAPRSLRLLSADLEAEDAAGTGRDLGLPEGWTITGLVPLHG